MNKRIRLRLEVPRSKDYYRLRYFWLRELEWLRAKRRNGTATKNELKAAQKDLAKVRKNG